MTTDVRHDSSRLIALRVCPSPPLCFMRRINMASVAGFVPVRRELIKSTPPKPFLIGVAGGSASGKVQFFFKSNANYFV